ncbi:membrane protein insertion efficiency factor YidD [Ralstonia wenshanensis]|uniref:Putative membrane protein insertion efficiency factor n=1 Tax=Ralstonia wenshanensis TaxID=2842456 RepID=A0AAD2B2M6_9RALS|nr:membrane protein insertion efficiency factor YidD [Ralstonia wenshanensis]CAJ0699191.1 Putative membrane protein insertion efficiency factor [Ralstonia wenshanensis]
MTRVLLFLLRIYKVAFSPFVGAQCRFLPTCSDYARDAVLTHGPGYGSYLAAKRLCRCHPFAQGGYDPVPPAAGDAVPRSPDPASTDATAADSQPARPSIQAVPENVASSPKLDREAQPYKGTVSIAGSRSGRAAAFRRWLHLPRP